MSDATVKKVEVSQGTAWLRHALRSGGHRLLGVSQCRRSLCGGLCPDESCHWRTALREDLCQRSRAGVAERY